MKKGIIKKTFATVLTLATCAGFYIGVNELTKSDLQKKYNDKNALLQEYRLTDEYQLQMTQKTEEKQSLNVDEKTEEILSQYGNEEFNQKLKEINEGILKAEEEYWKNFALLVSSSFLSIPVALYFMGTTDDFNYDKLEADEAYSSKPVII